MNSPVRPPETFQRAMKSVMLVMRSKACVWWLEDGDYDMARSTLGVCPDVRGKRSFAPTTVIARSKATRQSRSVYLARSALERDLRCLRIKWHALVSSLDPPLLLIFGILLVYSIIIGGSGNRVDCLKT